MLAVRVTLVLDDGANPFGVDHADLRHALVDNLEGDTFFVRGGEGHDVPRLEQKPRESVVIEALEFDADGGMTWEER